MQHNEHSVGMNRSYKISLSCCCRDIHVICNYYPTLLLPLTLWRFLCVFELNHRVHINIFHRSCYVSLNPSLKSICIPSS